MKAKWFFVLTAWARQRMAAVRDYLRLEDFQSPRTIDLQSTTTLARALGNLPEPGYLVRPASWAVDNLPDEPAAMLATWVRPPPGTTPRNVRRAKRNGGCNGAD